MRRSLSSRTVTHASAPTSTTTVYVRDLNDHIIAELNALGQTQREYIWLDDMPVAVVDNVASGNPVIYYVHVDHLMRPARMTAQDTSWVWDVIYAPFGGVSYIWSNPANIDLRFPGQWFQLESGLAYNWHRHYDATLGRYVQPDPIGYDGGRNVFAYVDGSPLGSFDPTGLNPVIAVGAICAEFPQLCVGIAAGAAGIVSSMVRKKNPPDIGPPGGWIQGPRRGRKYCPDGTPEYDLDKPHQGNETDHVHEWPGGVREEPGRPASPWPRQSSKR